jgi:hypothetical protein
MKGWNHETFLRLFLNGAPGVPVSPAKQAGLERAVTPSMEEEE